jgi:protein-S-isoprenylcysteine O-methyltransferase Ste14
LDRALAQAEVEGLEFEAREETIVKEFLSSLIEWNVVTGLWGVFVVYWTISALRVKRTAHTEASGARLAMVAGLVAGAALIFQQSGPFGRLNTRFVPERAWIKGCGELLVAAGVGIAIWARRHIGEFWSARVTLKEDHRLIQSGPYARVRHPIYTGVLVAMMGTALFVGEWRALLGVLLVFVTHWLKARREEALLTEQFGAEYREYRERTGSLVPRVY